MKYKPPPDEKFLPLLSNVINGGKVTKKLGIRSEELEISQTVGEPGSVSSRKQNL